MAHKTPLEEANDAVACLDDEDQVELKRYLKDLNERGGLPRTLRKVAHHSKVLRRALGRPFKEATAQEVKDAMMRIRDGVTTKKNGQPYSQESKVGFLEQFKAMYRFWLGDEKFDASGINRFKIVKGAPLSVRKDVALTEKEVKLYYEKCPSSENKRIAVIVWGMCARPGELQEHKVKDFQIDTDEDGEKFIYTMVKASKGGTGERLEPRTLTSPWVLPIAIDWLNSKKDTPDAYFIVNDSGKHIEQAGFAKSFKKFAILAGINPVKCFPNALRHGQIDHSRTKGFTGVNANRVFGHSDNSRQAGTYGSRDRIKEIAHLRIKTEPRNVTAKGRAENVIKTFKEMVEDEQTFRYLDENGWLEKLVPSLPAYDAKMYAELEKELSPATQIRKEIQNPLKSKDSKGKTPKTSNKQGGQDSG